MSVLPLRRLLPALLFFFLLCPHAGAVLSDDPGLDDSWKLVTDRKGIQVFMRHGDDSRLKTFRGVMRMPLRDEYAMLALYNDYDNYPQWLHLVDGASELGRDTPLRRRLRFTTHLPWPLSDREALLEADMSMHITPEDEHVIVLLNNKPELLPANDDYIRFPELEGLFRIKRLSPGEVEITYQLVLDPGGYIPSWLVNMLLRDTPYFTLAKLRRIIVQSEYQGLYFPYLDLMGPGRPKDIPPVKSYIYQQTGAASRR
ncbi:MAG: START domain-containing protein [Alcanivoracaceae bacterium]|nr:START domain-containing protein [Alcanivoracaceae bacterium]